MFERHVSRELAAYCDGQLTDGDASRVSRHLEACARCRREHEEIRFAARLARQLPLVAAPASLRAPDAGTISAVRSTGAAARLRLAFAFGAAAFLIAAAYWHGRPPAGGWWHVTRTAAQTTTTRLAAGEWVETDARSEARIAVGEIGTVDLAPGTRVRLGTASPAEYRLMLASGAISARISAPPRLFFVETPASTVVDLGCAYTVTINEQGTGELRVTEGWAALEWTGRQSLVPAGARSRIQATIGPGTPYFEDASGPLQDSLVRIDFSGGGPDALTVVLEEARPRDTLTLWHLLSRVAPGERGRIYDRMVALTPPPPLLRRDDILALDRDALTYWREELAWTW